MVEDDHLDSTAKEFDEIETSGSADYLMNKLNFLSCDLDRTYVNHLPNISNKPKCLVFEYNCFVDLMKDHYLIQEVILTLFDAQVSIEDCFYFHNYVYETHSRKTLKKKEFNFHFDIVRKLTEDDIYSVKLDPLTRGFKYFCSFWFH